MPKFEFIKEFDSKGQARTLHPSVVHENHMYETGEYSRSHGNGWTVTGEILEDHYYWVNDFTAYHPIYGNIKGNYETQIVGQLVEFKYCTRSDCYNFSPVAHEAYYQTIAYRTLTPKDTDVAVENMLSAPLHIDVGVPTRINHPFANSQADEMHEKAVTTMIRLIMQSSPRLREDKYVNQFKPN